MSDRDLDPGIKDVVAAFRRAGFETVDSGDGSKFGSMEGAASFEHVVIDPMESNFRHPSSLLKDALTCVLSVRSGERWQADLTSSLGSGDLQGDTVPTLIVYRLEDDYLSSVGAEEVME